GSLSALASAPFAAGTGPVSLTVDRAARFVYVVNNGGTSVTSYTLNGADGSLASSGTAGTGADPKAISVDPSGLYSYVANGSGTVSMFSVSQVDGHLTALGTPTVGAGSAPAAVALDASGAYAFVPNNGSNDVSLYSRNGGTGVLTPLTATSSTVRARLAPAAIAFTQGSSAVTFTPQYAYVGSDNDGVIGFIVNSATGDLTANAAGSQPGLGDARALSTDLRGRFLMSGAFSFNQLKSFTINPATGALTAVSVVGSGFQPFAVAVDPSGRFAYTANKG